MHNPRLGLTFSGKRSGRWSPIFGFDPNASPPPRVNVAANMVAFGLDAAYPTNADAALKRKHVCAAVKQADSAAAQVSEPWRTKGNSEV